MQMQSRFAYMYLVVTVLKFSNRVPKDLAIQSLLLCLCTYAVCSLILLARSLNFRAHVARVVGTYYYLLLH
jgi:hypothetical protein